MKWAIEGAYEQTGEEASVVINAESREMAIETAAAFRFLVVSVREFDESAGYATNDPLEALASAKNIFHKHIHPKVKKTGLSWVTIFLICLIFDVAILVFGSWLNLPILTGFGMVVLFISFAVCACWIIDIPRQIAMARNHPNVTAITVCSWMAILFLPLYPVAIIWAFTVPANTSHS